jgi:ParB family transcriptional regulator, chromosome partitioning protein
MTTTTENPVAEEKPTTPSVDKRRALGRGLESLLPGGSFSAPDFGAGLPRGGTSDGSVSEPPKPHVPTAEAQPQHSPSARVAQIPLEQIDENPYQTRQIFDQSALQELADSIRANGVVQPVVVRPTASGRYLLILGERRCRASRLAGKLTIPAVIRTVSDQQAAQMTVVENLQRQDLNCLEQAQAFARLSREFGLTQEQIGQRTGMARESISNYMRLLKLPLVVQGYLRKGDLGFSEARVLLQLSDAENVLRIAEQAIRDRLSVARLQELVDRTNHPQPAEPRTARWQDPNVNAVQGEMERALGVRVRINDRNGKGRIVIDYASLEDFDRVVGMLRART